MSEEDRSHIPYETQIREAFEKELEDADSDDKKVALLKRIFDAIADMAVSSDEVVEDTENQNAGLISDKLRSKKEDIARPILQLIRFITKVDDGTIDEQVVADADLDDVQRAFLGKLAAKRHSADSAAFLSQIIGRAIERSEYLQISINGGQKTQLEKDFEKIKRNKAASESFADGLRTLAEQHKLVDTDGNEVTAEVVNQRFTSDPTQVEIPKNKEQLEDLAEEANEVIARIERVFNPSFQQITLLEKEAQQTRESIKANPALSNEEREEQLEAATQRLNHLYMQRERLERQKEAVHHYIQTGEPSAPFTDEDDPEAAIMEFMQTQLRFSNEEVKRMKNVRSTYAEHISKFGLEGSDRLSGYQELMNKINKLTPQKMFEYIWKNHNLNPQGLKELKTEIENLVSELFEGLANDPQAEYNEAFSPYVEGTVFKNITTLLRTNVEKVTKLIEEDQREFYNKTPTEALKFSQKIRDEMLKEQLVAEIERRSSIERIVHQYQKVGALVGIEQLKEILRTYDITTLQEFYRDEMTVIVNDLLPQFIQQLYLENGNHVITDLLQILQSEKEIEVSAEDGAEKITVQKFVVRYRDEFIDYAYNILTQLHEEGDLDYKPTRERISAQFSRAYLDNFLLSLRGLKVVSQAIPEHDFVDVPFLEALRIFNPRHRWGKFGERGRGPQGQGDAETYEFSGMRNFIYDEEGFKLHWLPKYGNVYAKYRPKEEMAVAKSRVLYNIMPDNEELQRDLESRRWDYFQTMPQVYQGMAFGNIIDQAGWPFTGFVKDRRPKLFDEMKKHFQEHYAEEYQDHYEGVSSYDDLDWEHKFDLYYRTAGVVPAFWLVFERAKEEVEFKFIEHLAGTREAGRVLSQEEKKAMVTRYRNKLGKEDFDKKVSAYTTGEKRFEQIIPVKINGQERMVTFRDYFNQRIQSLRGEVFYQLLLKDPHAWMGELSQLLMHNTEKTNITQGYVQYEKPDGKPSDPIPYSEFLFNLDQHPDSAMSKEWKEERDRFRFQALTIFRGTDENVMSNVPHLKKVLDFYTNVVDAYMPEGVAVTAETMDEAHKAARNGGRMFAQQAQLARRRAVKHQQAEINPEHLVTTKDGIEDRRIYNLLYGNNGMTTYFNNMVGQNRADYFGDGNENLGEEFGFFKRYGRSFDRDNRHHHLPEGDTNMELLVKNINDKQSLERRLSTDEAFIKAQEVIDNIPSVCGKATDAKSIDEWYSIIEEGIHKELKVIADEDQGLEQQYQLEAFTMVVNWFMKDHRANTAFIGGLKGIRLNNDVSISTIKADWHQKFVLTQDRIHIYIRKLREKRYLKTGFNMLGGFGLETAEMSTGATYGVLLGRQLMYVGVMAPILIVGAMIKEAYDEQVEEQGKNT